MDIQRARIRNPVWNVFYLYTHRSGEYSWIQVKISILWKVRFCQVQAHCFGHPGEYRAEGDYLIHRYVVCLVPDWRTEFEQPVDYLDNVLHVRERFFGINYAKERLIYGYFWEIWDLNQCHSRFWNLGWMANDCVEF